MLPISEIILKLKDHESDEDKLKWLQQNSSASLYDVINGAYNETVEWLIPDSAPPWKKNNLRRIERRLYTETRRLKIFQKGGGYDGMDKVKREYLFISLLESVDDADADLLVEMLTKRCFKNLPDDVAFVYLKNYK